MGEPAEPAEPPAKRIGDAERDKAVELLTEHMSSGRLSAEEFDERLDAALAARTMADLDPLFDDLPGDRPSQALVPPEPPPPPVEPDPRARTRRVGQVVIAMLWPVAIISMIAFGIWWPVLIPIFGTGAIAAAFGLTDGDERRRRMIEHQRRFPGPPLPPGAPRPPWPPRPPKPPTF